MKYFIFIILFTIQINFSNASDLLIYLESAHKNNPLLNSERENFKATKENINISISKFLPNVSI